MARPVVHFEIIGKDPQRLRTYFGELFGWQFDTSSPVAEAVSEPTNYGFTDRITTPDGAGIPGGIGGGAGYQGHVIFYVGVPDVEAALAQAERLGGKRQMGPVRAPTGLVVGHFTDPEGNLIGVAGIALATAPAAPSHGQRAASAARGLKRQHHAPAVERPGGRAAVHTTGCTDRCSGMTIMEAGAARETGPQRKRLAARSRRVMGMTAIGAVAAGSLAFWLAGCSSGGSDPGTTTVRNGEVWLQGQITQDGCDMSKARLPIGDVGCTITVNGYYVTVVQGNIRLPGKPGTVTGLDVSENQVGSHAAVYARLIGPHSASVLSAAKYYARISS